MSELKVWPHFYGFQCCVLLLKSNRVPKALCALCLDCHVHVTNGQCEVEVMVSPINSVPPALIEAVHVPQRISELITFEPLAIITPSYKTQFLLVQEVLQS